MLDPLTEGNVVAIVGDRVARIPAIKGVSLEPLPRSLGQECEFDAVLDENA